MVCIRSEGTIGRVIAKSQRIGGVSRVFAESKSEVRRVSMLFVEPAEVTRVPSLGQFCCSRQISSKIEKELQFPGQIGTVTLTYGGMFNANNRYRLF